MSDGSKGKVAKGPNTAKKAPGPQEKPKKKLTWKERLAELPEDEAAELRAKAAEASRRSKAKKRGTPEVLVARIKQLETKLAKIEERQAALNAERQKTGEELEGVRAELAAMVDGHGGGDSVMAKDQPEDEPEDVEDEEADDAAEV